MKKDHENNVSLSLTHGAVIMHHRDVSSCSSTERGEEKMTHFEAMISKIANSLVYVGLTLVTLSILALLPYAANAETPVKIIYSIACFSTSLCAVSLFWGRRKAQAK
jgi:uncharacterized membrane protein